MTVTESDYWIRLEYQVTGALGAMDGLGMKSPWCDGFLPQRYVLDERAPRITGVAWICDGPKQSEWEFRLDLRHRVGSRDEVRWDELLPPDEATGWLTVDVDKRHIRVTPFPELRMSCRGVFFALTEQQTKQLEGAAGDDRQLMKLVEELETAWDEDHLAECDKAWDAMHRLLTNGELEYGNGSYPLSHCVLGPRQLYQAEDSIISLVSAAEVKDVAAALATITKEWFDDRYFTTVPFDYAPEFGDEDRESTWVRFEGVRELYVKAAAEGRAVVFVVDQ